LNTYIKKNLWLIIIVIIGIYAPHTSSAVNKYSIPVLLYHRIGYTSDTLTITPERLSLDLTELQENGYETISLSTFEDYVGGKDVQLPSKPILITFDDSYQDNYDTAFQILKQKNDVATFFVITGFIDKYKDRLTSQEITEMYAAGMSFGSHTVSHTPLAKESQDVMWNELFFSKQFLEETLKVPINTIAYPEGSYNSETIRLATGLGYNIGFTVKSGVCKRTNPPFTIPRVPIFHYTEDVLDAINDS
jgi:peptidoglycan/xylan/chitin deacetylase (PgdA/CDA1 family)